MDPQISAPADTKPATTTTTMIAEPPANPIAQPVASQNVLQLASETPLPPIPQDEVANSTALTSTGPGQVPVVSGDVIDTAPPPAYMSVDPEAIPIPAQKSVPVNPSTRIAERPENYVIELKHLGEIPEFVDCPHCSSRQKTIVQLNGSSEQGMAALICCLCCGIIGGLIPILCNWSANVDHVCPHCHKTVAHMPYGGKMEPVLPTPGPELKPGQFQPPTAPPKPE